MTYTVMSRLPWPVPFSWHVVDEESRFYATETYVDALALAAMLNMLTPDQRNAAAAEAVAKWKEPEIT